MKPRFLADADLKLAIVIGVKRREPSVDFMSAQAARLEGLEDSGYCPSARTRAESLFRTISGRCRAIFAILCPKITVPEFFLISQATAIGVAVESLLDIWAASDSAEWENQLTYLPL